MLVRGYTYRLLPSPDVEQMLMHYAGVTRLVYNLCLEQRTTWWRQYKRSTGKVLNFATQGPQITALRAEFDWIREVPCDCLHRALRDLDSAFAAFFRKGARYPRFRKKGENDSFRFMGRDVSVRRLNGKWSMVKLPKVGWIKFRDTRPMRGVVKNATISHKSGEWQISFCCEFDGEAVAPPEASVGIDRGIATTLALSTGEMLSLPASLQQIELQKRKAQRVTSRRKRGSNRRRRAQKRVSNLQAKQARIRRDFHHRAALDIAQRFGVAALEALNTRSMATSAKGTIAEPGRKVRQKAGLNRAILNAGWHQFATILTYKMEERGGQVVTVPAQFTSQTCAACGVIDAQSRESQARFACVSCGHTAHADINAAINIERRWSTSLLDVEGLHQRPREASTEKGLLGPEQPVPLVA